MAGGLPGRLGEGGVYVRGGCSGSGDSDERGRVGGDPVPVALERYQVVAVELASSAPWGLVDCKCELRVRGSYSTQDIKDLAGQRLAVNDCQEFEPRTTRV